MTTDAQTLREIAVNTRFEVWAEQHRLSLRRTNNGHYISMDTQLAEAAWNAALAASQEQRRDK